MKYRLLALTVIAASTLLGACNKNTDNGSAAMPAKTAKGPAALIDGKPLSMELLEFYAKNRTGKSLSELTDAQKQEVLNELIGLQAASQAAVKNGVDRDPDTAARIELTRMNVLAETQVAKNVPDERPTEQELRAEYETQIAALPQVEYHARHILVATEPFAQSIIEKLQAGGNFEQLARKESMDSTKESGGDLGWFMATRMVPEFAKAVTELKKGEMTTKPVRTQFGFHIIRLEDTRPVSPPEFETVKERLVAMVRQRKVQAYVDNLKKDMKIEKKI